MKSDTRIYIYIEGEDGRRKGERSKTPPLHPQKRVNTMTSHPFSSECPHRHNPAFPTPFSLCALEPRYRNSLREDARLESWRRHEANACFRNRSPDMDRTELNSETVSDTCEYHLASFFLDRSHDKISSLRNTVYFHLNSDFFRLACQI